MRRKSSGKRLELTARDLAIFTLLAHYRYLRSTFLHAFVGGASETRFKERLCDLFHEGYIDRPVKQWEFASARYRPVVYEIGEGARRVLCEAGIAAGDARTFLAPNAHRQFAHSLMICEVLASIELGARNVPNLRFISWPEILARAPESTRASVTPFRIPVATGALIPDGLLGLEYQSGGKRAYRFFALEVDRGTMPIARTDGKQTSYLGKLASYQEIMAGTAYKSWWGTPNLFVLTIATGEQRLSEIMRKFGERGDNPPFLFKALGEPMLAMPASQLLTDPWDRAGLPPLRIDN
jgi:hypothetical protein